MSSNKEEFLKRVSATANQLRQVQVDFSDEPAEKKRDYLSEVVERTLKKILPDERQAFLEELRFRFPTWQTVKEYQPQKIEVKVDQPKEDPHPPDPSDPHALTEQLLQAVVSLPPEQKQAIVQQLANGGLVEAEETQEEGLSKATKNAVQYVMKQLDIEKLDMTRAVKLLALLSDFLCNSEQVAWNTWRTVAPRSTMRRPSNLRQQLAKYLRGDRDASGRDIKNNIDYTRKFYAALIGGVGQVGREFANQHLEALSPQKIETRVNAEPGGMLIGREVKCWRKYVELSKKLDEAFIEDAIKDAIAKHAESLMQASSAS